jgi:hypothetical protein
VRNFLLRDFLLREKKATVPSLTAIARYPSSLISHTHPGASGSFVTARHSIGSMKHGTRVGRESESRAVGSGHPGSVKVDLYSCHDHDPH